MNDFTKEDLQEIKRCLKYMINGGVTPYSNLTMAIKKKIQSMIDNYCEHDFDMNDWVNDSSGCRWHECKKCKGYYR